jgi:hypothetical protein
MGLVAFDQNSKSLEITYGGRENPFMGIDSSFPDPYIGPGQLTRNSVNAIVNNGTLLATFFRSISQLSSGLIIGFGDLNGQVFVVSLDPSQNVDVTGIPNFPSLTGIYSIAAIPTAAVYGTALGMNVQPNTLTYKNINGVCFFSFPGCPFIFQHNNLAGNILTTYLGASFLSEFNGRLIAANVYQITGVTSNTYTPTQQVTGIGTSSGNGGSSTGTSSVINTFPSEATGGDYVNINVTIQGTYSCNPQNNNANVSNLEFQYSPDGGTTWITFYSWSPNTTNQTLSSQQIPILNVIGITNINTIQLRIVASTTAGVGVNVVSAISGEITAATAQIVGAPSTLTITNFPFQYAWSAPTGQYGQFNPQTTDQFGNTVVTGAGYNNLPDVEDVITGLFNTGPTEFVLRGQGITEVTALQSGIQPFQFDHLWASHKGIGTIYPDTVGQYGSLGAFFADTGIFTFGYEGINEVGYKALSAIYTDLVQTCKSNFLSGGLGPLYINGEVYLCYILCAVDTSGLIYIWVLNIKTKEWYRFQTALNMTCFGLQVIGVNLGTISQTNQNSVFITALTNNGIQAYILGLPINGTLTTTPAGPTAPATEMIFPAEELKIARDITIDSIVVGYAGHESLTAILDSIFSINGIPYETIEDSNVNVDFDTDFNYVVLAPNPLNNPPNPYTGKNPQLSVQTSITAGSIQTALLVFSKIVLMGSMDSTQRPAGNI